MAVKRKTYQKKTTARKPFWESLLEWILGFFKKLVIPGLVLWLVAWLWVGGLFARAGDAVWHGFVDWTAAQGLTVTDIVVEGRNRTLLTDLQKAIAVKPNDSLLAVDVEAIRDRIVYLGWVDTVVVRRSYNGVVTIDLTERVPFVIWDRPGRGKVVVDTNGKVIDVANVKDFKSLLNVRGVDAPHYAADLMRMIIAEPDVAKYINGAEWIGDRRWDLLTTMGTHIHLPAEDMGLALSRLAKAQREQNILDRDLKSLDLRVDDRIIIETPRGQARDVISSNPAASRTL